MKSLVMLLGRRAAAVYDQTRAEKMMIVSSMIRSVVAQPSPKTP